MTPGEPIALIGHDVVLRRGVSGNWRPYFTRDFRLKEQKFTEYDWTNQNNS